MAVGRAEILVVADANEFDRQMRKADASAKRTFGGLKREAELLAHRSEKRFTVRNTNAFEDRRQICSVARGRTRAERSSKLCNADRTPGVRPPLGGLMRERANAGTLIVPPRSAVMRLSPVLVVPHCQ